VPTLSIGEWPLDGSWFPPFDPVREAGARTDSPPFTPMCSSPPSVCDAPAHCYPDDGRLVLDNQSTAEIPKPGVAGSNSVSRCI
jgi:hypothetical protein